MDNFIKIIDTYLLNYSTYKNGKIEFDCELGELTFYKKDPNCLTIFGIYIYPEHRQKGICRTILEYLIDNSKNFKYICVKSVLSKILYEYLLRFKYKSNKYKNNTFSLCRVSGDFVFKLV